MAVIWITHDLGVVARLAQRVLVMYAGYVIEDARVETLYTTPRHPYTLGLLGSLPRLNSARGSKLFSIPGQPPDLAHLPADAPLPPVAAMSPSAAWMRTPFWKPLPAITTWRAGKKTQQKECGPMSNQPDRSVLLQVNDLKKYFPITRGVFRRHVGDVKAVDGVSFDIYQGETLGLVGESGCGKSTTGRTILQVYPPTAGQVLLGGKDLATLGHEEMRQMRRRMQLIFQDPYASLNPRMTVGSIVGEALDIFGLARGAERRDRVEELLYLVGLNPYFISRYPHEFSGGQRQRVGIARALAINPDFIVCDEPIAALDVSIQAQVVNLLEELQERLGLTYLFIAHDLSMVRHISDRIAVMYLGKIVELTDRDSLYHNPLHPYTKRYFRPFLFLIRCLRRGGSALCCRGMFPAPPTRRRAVTLIPAARLLSHGVMKLSQRLSKSRLGIG